MKIRAPFLISIEQFTSNINIMDVHALRGTEYAHDCSFIVPLQETQDATRDDARSDLDDASDRDRMDSDCG